MGLVCGAFLQGLAERHPAATLILCTVKARRPSPFAQSEEDRAATAEFYRGMGFREMSRRAGVFRCLQPLVAAATFRRPPPQSAGKRLSALGALLADSALLCSLPMMEGDMLATAARRISWWELAGREGGAGAWWAALAEEPAAAAWPDWLVAGAAAEVAHGGSWCEAHVAEVRSGGPRGPQARIRYRGDGGVDSGEVRRSAAARRPDRARRRQF